MLPYIGNIVLYLFILISLLYITYKVNQGKYYPRLLYKCYFLLFIYLGTYAYFTGDYAHYQHEISRLSTNPLNPTHMEFVYIFLAKWVNGDYTLWRLHVFVTMFLLLGYLLKLTRTNNFQTLFWYSLFILPDAVGGRCPIAITAYFIAVVYLSRRKYLQGFFFAILGAFMHKTILPILLFLPFSRIKINSKLFVLSYPLFLIVGITFNRYLIDYLAAYGFISKESFEGYLQYDKHLFASIGGTIGFFIMFLPYNFAVIANIKALLGYKIKIKDISIVRLRSFTNVFVLFLLLGLFLFGTTSPMFYRYYEMLKYPLLLLLPYMYPKLYQLRLTKNNFNLLMLFMFSQLYSVSLSAYYEYCAN